MTDQAKLPPVDTPLTQGDPDSGHGTEPTTADAPEPEHWFKQAGFETEEEAQMAAKRYTDAQRKISQLGQENSRLRQTQQAGTQTPAAGNTDQQYPQVSSEAFYENPADAIAQISRVTAKEAISEVLREQKTERMITDAATREGVERWEIEQALQEMQNDPEKAVHMLAAIAKMRKGVPTDDIKAAVERDIQNKARATQTTTTSHVPDDVQPNWGEMSYLEMKAEMEKRGQVVPSKTKTTNI